MSRWPFFAAALALFGLAAPASALPTPTRLSAPPVLLVHGIDDTEAIFEKMKQRLRSAGVPRVYSLDMVPNNGDRSLRELAVQVEAKVAAIRHETGAGRIDLVAYSMGAMVSRYYLQKLGGVSSVRRFVTLAAPHHGTVSAYFRWNPGAEDMRPYSPFLAELAETAHVLEAIEVHSLWTPFDLMILPSISSRLPGAEERILPVLAHPLMVTDDRACKTVCQVLAMPVSEIEAHAD